MSKQISKIIFKTLLFLLIGILIFEMMQYLFMPKWFPYDQRYEAGKMKYYFGEEKNTIDVLICGTSHPSRGILPMEMYEAYGIKSYNLATGIQPIEVTYYMLREAIKAQNPQVIIWDVSNLYITSEESWRWKMIIDEMPLCKNKKKLIDEYLLNFEEEREGFFELLFPLLGYHSRWKELAETDFDMMKSNKHYFAKGGQIKSVMYQGISVEEMNSITEQLQQNTERVMYEYNGEGLQEVRGNDILYQIDVPESNVGWLLKIKELCDTNDIRLLAVKIPAVYAPQWYTSAWTREKYNKTYALCKEYGITYYDLLYDTDINIDFGKDSSDGGLHLNLYGAQKCSEELGNYLRKYYELSEERSEQWDRDLLSYQKVRDIAMLELEQDFSTYINMLVEKYKDKMIFLVVSDDMSRGLNKTDINALRGLGLRADFSEAFQCSYIAVLKNGNVEYEVLSNRRLDYGGVCGASEKAYWLYSSGYWTGSGASIQLDGREYAVNGRGVNIVVYDDERELVLDSVAFDTYEEYHMPARNNAMIYQMEEEFEHYIMEVEDNNAHSL